MRLIGHSLDGPNVVRADLDLRSTGNEVWPLLPHPCHFERASHWAAHCVEIMAANKDELIAAAERSGEEIILLSAVVYCMALLDGTADDCLVSDWMTKH